MVLVSQTGLLLVATGAAGIAFITTFVVPAILVQPLTVTVTEYIPAAAVVTLLSDGFCCVDVKPFGPVHAYDAPATLLAFNIKVLPEHTGLLLDAVGATGVGIIVTLTLPTLLVQPFTVTSNE